MNKRIVIVLLGAVGMILLASCNTGVGYSVMTEQNKAVVENDDYSWIDVYIEALRGFDYFSYPTAALIYINDDEIPELVFEGNCNADGTMLLTIGTDNSVKWHKSGYSISYIPEKNIVYGYYAGGGGIDEEILCIDDGDWKSLFYGTSAFVPDPDTGDYKKYDYKIYENGDFEEEAGVSVLEDDYDDMMNTLFTEKGYKKDDTKNVEMKLHADELFEELKNMRPSRKSAVLDETKNNQNSKFYGVSQTYEIGEIVKKYSIGHTLDGGDRIRNYNGDIGDLIDAYKSIDLNGDGKIDSICRNASDNDEEDLEVSYTISITDGADIDTPVFVDEYNLYTSGGDVFEFNDINNDGCDEVLHTLYGLSTGGYYIKSVNLYYVSKEKWERFDFTDDLDAIVGAELTDDGIA